MTSRNGKNVKDWVIRSELLRDKCGSSMECVQRLYKRKHKQSLIATVIGLRGHHNPNEGLRYSLVPMGNYGVFRNIHVPKSLESQVELKMISAAQYNAQSSKPNIAIVQDSLSLADFVIYSFLVDFFMTRRV